VREEGGDLPDAADVFGAIFVREPKVGCETGAHVIAVENVNLKAALEERLFEGNGERRLAGA